jgi:hypothetical protein
LLNDGPRKRYGPFVAVSVQNAYPSAIGRPKNDRGRLRAFPPLRRIARSIPMRSMGFFAWFWFCNYFYLWFWFWF